MYDNKLYVYRVLVSIDESNLSSIEFENVLFKSVMKFLKIN